MILAAIRKTALRRGWRAAAVEDATGVALSYQQLLLRSFVLARLLRKMGVGPAPFVGILLPTSIGATAAFLALHGSGRTPAMLNFTAGPRSLALACRTGGITHVITSRVFIEKARLEALLEALPVTFLCLEDVRQRITLGDKLAALCRLAMPPRSARPEDCAVLLFTSGSEGAPKGVALSHRNLLANIEQAGERFTFSAKDAMFNALPIFHSFGLTVGTLLPLVLGFRAYLYPTPLHYQTIPELVRKTGATIFLGTDTFFCAYARHAAAGDFSALRLAVAGAEKLKPETMALYRKNYGTFLLEGYGVTEASPVVAANTPQERKEGTVGRLMPRMECRLEKIEGLARGGRLLLRGPNIMLGYVSSDQPGIIVPQAEWYDTGDIADVDAEGYLTILGRLRRFAKIGGEMVPLSLAEEAAAAAWPGSDHAAIAVADARRGEQIVLFTECAEAARDGLLVHAQRAGIPEIALPKRIVHTQALPRLGSGKIDYLALRELELS